MSVAHKRIRDCFHPKCPLEDLRNTEAHRLGDDVLIHMGESGLLLDTFRPAGYVTTNTTAAAAWRFM